MGCVFFFTCASWAGFSPSVLQIIERSLPKKQKVKKDPSLIEKEEMEKIGRVWVNIVRRDIPKHHRMFTTFHRKQLIDAKRVSENCQREVLMMSKGNLLFCFFSLYSFFFPCPV